MKVVTTKAELNEQLDEWRHNDEHVALVATMGNLHEGHMSLVEQAREHAERVVVTVYINPTQFAEDEDFEEYPRTLERDTRKLKIIGADLVFVPTDDVVYPFGIENATTVRVPGLSDNFCGKFRPGHFTGVTTVVMRLFTLVRPDVAIFGQKDYQQQLLIRHMAEDLNLPIRIITAETVREEDGLAMSSRNQYLTEKERAIAPQLHAVLDKVGHSLQSGSREFADLEKAALEKLEKAGFAPTYVAIRRAENLGAPDRDCDELVVLAAAKLGAASLIDNVVVSV